MIAEWYLILYMTSSPGAAIPVESLDVCKQISNRIYEGKDDYTNYGSCINTQTGDVWTNLRGGKRQ